MQRQQSCSIQPLVISIPPRLNGSDVWRQHNPGKSERDRLDNLMGLALVDQSVRDRLLVQRDPSLLDDLNLSDDTRHWLNNIQARTLTEFAQAIVRAFIPTSG